MSWSTNGCRRTDAKGDIPAEWGLVRAQLTGLTYLFLTLWSICQGMAGSLHFELHDFIERHEWIKVIACTIACSCLYPCRDQGIENTTVSRQERRDCAPWPCLIPQKGLGSYMNRSSKRSNVTNATPQHYRTLHPLPKTPGLGTFELGQRIEATHTTDHDDASRSSQ